MQVRFRRRVEERTKELLLSGSHSQTTQVLTLDGSDILYNLYTISTTDMYKR